jgi:hypothetical protein
MDITKLSFTDGVAGVAAIVAFTALIWNIIRDLNDRANLKLSVTIGKLKKSTDDKIFVFSGKNFEKLPGKYVLAIFMTNIGKRPLLAEKWYLIAGTSKEDKKSFRTIIPFNLPFKLNESETHSEMTADLDTIPNPIHQIVVLDSTGKKWYVNNYQIRELNNNYKNIFKTETIQNNPLDEKLNK